MTLDVSIGMAEDWRVWDGLENITVHAKNTGGSTPAYIASAKRRALSTKEIARSNGVYTSDDIVWLFPASLVSVPPRPADWIVPGDDTDARWTILDVQLGKLRNTYRCTTRNPYIAGRLYDTVTIRTPTNLKEHGVTGAVGVKQWRNSYQALRVRVQPMQSGIVDERGIRGFQTAYEIYVPYEVTVTNEDQVVHGSKVYDVTGYRSAERLEELPVIEARLAPL